MTGLGRSWPLSRQLVVGTIALVLVTLILSGGAALLALRASLYERLDQEVRMGLAILAGPARDAPGGGAGGGGGVVDPGPDDGSGGGSGPDAGSAPRLRLDTLEVVIAADGTATRASTVGPDGTVASLTAAQLEVVTEAADRAEQPTTVDLGGTAGSFRVAAQSGPDGTVVAGTSLRDTTATIASLGGILVVVAVAALILVGAGIAWLVTSALRPLRRVAGTAERVAQRPLAVGAVTLPERAGLAEDPGTEVGRVGAALDTLLNHVETALGARQESEERLRAFIADASHELRTPLASIRGYAQLAHAEAVEMPATQARSLERIESEAERMGALVEDLLLLARLDSGQRLRREPVDVTMLAIETVSDLHAAMPDHEWIVEVDEPVEVRGDAPRIRQVLINLLGNAGRHTPAGTRVTAAVTRVGGEAVMSVSDDGPGIAPELLPRLFDRFTRGDAARNRDAGSTGLGLAIASAIVQEHGGRIDVASGSAGTSFEVALPLLGAGEIEQVDS
ncbi:HAMP domain-containing histidine kinase [Leucobacter allii]|uniref:sensor histidine kinase n=1 Tax=Leucobacter allii TaxID=2932247 RepID=UPI001FD34895|nr:ATP-binding protein [Leucobacter allii]UOR01219.1 HAMP domain-containing histidine kinase [Leucobacter allii]